MASRNTRSHVVIGDRFQIRERTWRGEVVLAVAWGVGLVIALRTDELRKEEGSGEYWRAKAAEGSTIELQRAPLSTARLRWALLPPRCFRGSYMRCGSSRVIPGRL
jgi:hypothetical protein